MKDASVLIGFHTLPARGRSVNAWRTRRCALALASALLGCGGATTSTTTTLATTVPTTESAPTDEAIFLGAKVLRCEPDILAGGYEAAEAIDDWLSSDELGPGNVTEDAFVASIETFRLGTSEVEVRRQRSMRGTDSSVGWTNGPTRHGAVRFHEASTTPDVPSVGRLFDVLDVGPERILATACRSEWGEPTKCVYALVTAEGVRTIGELEPAMVDPLPLRVGENVLVVAGHAFDDSQAATTMYVDTIDLARSSRSRIEVDLGSRTTYFGLGVVDARPILYRFEGDAWTVVGSHETPVDPFALGLRACEDVASPTHRFRIPMRLALSGTPFAFRASPDFELEIARDASGACGAHVELARRWAGPGSVDGAVGAELERDRDDPANESYRGRMITPFGILETRCAHER